MNNLLGEATPLFGNKHSWCFSLSG